MSPSRQQLLDWAELAELCEAMADRCSVLPCDAILAIARGGLVPAAILAQRLGQRHILSAALASYQDGRRGRQLRFLEFPSQEVLAGRRILVVDDIWDSGRTAVKVRQRLQAAGAEPFLAVLHYKPLSSSFPDQEPELWMEQTEDWVVYPWETRR